jgi:exopolyphosphatase/pppGpp-phosphohydrolase
MIFGFVTDKIKTVALGVLAVLLPILYILGRRDQSKIERTNALEDALETEHDRADFYRTLEKRNNDIQNNRPSNRDDLVKRLRDNGL